MIKLILIALLLFLTACSDSKPKKTLNEKLLLQEKCASCHNLNIPPIISNDELAPPMMAVAFHVHNFMKPKDESQRTNQAINFVVDYVLEPSLKKSFCDKESLKRYGLMPSQKGNVTEDELHAISSYIFRHYTQENLSKVQKEQAIYNALSDGKKLALKYRCLGCHKRDIKVVGPSFNAIANKYKNNKTVLLQSIKNGSKDKWKISNGAVMPAFENIKNDDLMVITEWIYNKSE